MANTPTTIAEAEAQLRQLLRDDPANILAIHDLGVLAFRDARPKEALHLLQQALLLDPENLAILKSYGQVLRETGDSARAAQIFHHALDLDPTSAAVWNAAGVCLQESGNSAKAMESYLRALALKPAFPEALHNIGNVLFKENDIDAAIDHFQQAITLKPDYTDAHINVAVAYRERLDYQNATTHFRRAVELKPDNAGATAGLGEILSLVYDPSSESILRRVVALTPDNAEAHWNLALDLLKRGNYTEGWREHEWRWKRGHGHNTPRPFSQPYWLGEDIRNRTLLLHAEQGFGDTLQMLRYLPLVLARGANVVLEVQQQLYRLVSTYAKTLATPITVIAVGDPLPPFDIHAALMSLPLIFHSTTDTIPPPIRLTPPALREPNLRIGIAWAGNKAHPRDRERSLSLELLRPLFDIPNCTFVSLQTGTAVLQIQSCNLPLEQPPLHDFTDTTIILDTLDLVLTIDSAVAHLAATQGIPTWILLPFVADWRWLQPSTTIPATQPNPWYSNAKLFRQISFPDTPNPKLRWQPVIDAVASELRKLTH